MIGIAIFFIALGILVKYGKMYFLIAGYNTMSKEKKARYDVDGIASVFRNGLFGMALILIAGYFLAAYLENPQIETYSLYAALILGLPYLLILSNSGKYKVKDGSSDT